MKSKKYKFLFLLFFIPLAFCYAQNYRYYLKTIEVYSQDDFIEKDGKLDYIGNDTKFASVFHETEIYYFKKAFVTFKSEELKGIYYLESATSKLESILQEKKVNYTRLEFIGVTGSFLSEEEELLEKTNCFPNDYGRTGGSNQGLNVDNHGFDFIGVPDAYCITGGGDVDVDVGISDGGPLVLTDYEFVGKTTELPNEINYSPIHGNTVAAIVAAQGNNAKSTSGVCYNCSIIKNGFGWEGPYGSGNFDRINELSLAGARVVNCSWGAHYEPSQSEQIAINEITENGTIIVAAAHNSSWASTGGNLYFYPASYNNVISVSSVGSRHTNPTDSLYVHPIDGSWRNNNVQHYIGSNVGFIGNPNNNPNATPFIYPQNTNVLNDSVDLLAPSYDLYRYGAYLFPDGGPNNENTSFYPQFFSTSRAAPVVTGVIGLMKSLNLCLSFKEAESILKITSTNIDHIQANQFAAGKYGAGTVHAGRATQLTYDLMTTTEVAYLENQKFTRWDFIFNGVSESIVMQNQEFKEGSTVTVNAKNEIILNQGTLLDPNSSGFALFEIDPLLEIETNCPIGSPSDPGIRLKENSQIAIYDVYPTMVKSEMNIINSTSKEVIITSVKVFDIFNQEVFVNDKINTSSILLELSFLPRGIYILKGFDKNIEDVLTIKFIKE